MSEAELVTRARMAFAAYSGLGRDLINEMITAIETAKLQRARDKRELTASLAREGEMRRDTLEEAAKLCDQRAAEDEAVAQKQRAEINPKAAHEYQLTANTWIIAAEAIRALTAPSSGEEKSHGASAAERNIPRNVHNGKDTE